MSCLQSVAGVVLAAGGSRRLGRPKQLVEPAGETLVHAAAHAISVSRCVALSVVVGAEAAAVTAAVSDLHPVVLENDGWAEGIASSIRVGTAWASQAGYEGILITVCDQPLLTAAHLDRLLLAFLAEGRPIGSAYAGIIGVPAVFGRRDFARLLELRGDRGAAGLLRREAGSVPWPEGLTDIDTPEQLAAAERGHALLGAK